MESSSINLKLGVVIGKLDGIEGRLDKQDESRAVLHRRMDELILRQTHLEADVSSLKHKVDGMEEVTGTVRTLTNQAQGAGIMGRGLLTLGGWLLGAAGWLYGAYLWFMGRPPP